MRNILIFLWLFALTAMPATAGAALRDVELPNGEKIPLYHYPSAGSDLPVVLWLPTSRGVQTPMHAIAEAMAGAGVETWIADLHMAYFVDVGRDSLDAFPDRDLATLIEEISDASGRGVVVMAGNRAAVKALSAVRILQTSGRGTLPVRGAILDSPALYESPPRPGAPAAWLPIARAVNVPVFMIQPGISTGTWRAQETADVLASGGSAVFVHRLEGVQGGYLMRPDHDLDKIDIEARAAAPGMLARGVALLARMQVPENAAELPADIEPPAIDGPRFGLKALSGKPPSMLELPTFGGDRSSLDEHLGPATIVSFWASWCPPCIEELPSLGRLYRDFADQGLRIVTINVGENVKDIANVVEEYAMQSYALLMDQDGREMKRWNVYGFPTNFIVGDDGALRFGSFGAVNWDDPEVRERVNSLF